VALAKSFTSFSLHPLMGGLDPDFAWKSVKLFTEKVLPRL
jgi:hypothetical protein